MFASNQIGGWSVVGLRGIHSPIPLCERDARGVTNGLALKTPHSRSFVFLSFRPFVVSSTPFFASRARHACNKRFATMFAYKELSALLQQHLHDVSRRHTSRKRTRGAEIYLRCNLTRFESRSKEPRVKA